MIGDKPWRLLMLAVLTIPGISVAVAWINTPSDAVSLAGFGAILTMAYLWVRFLWNLLVGDSNDARNEDGGVGLGADGRDGVHKGGAGVGGDQG